VLVGRYVSENQPLIRTESMDCPVGSRSPACRGTTGAGRGGYTYGDLSAILGQAEVHASGEIWGQTLWDLPSRLGSKFTEKLVTRAMELSPDNPSFLDMRNAIIRADTVTNGGDARSAIWQTFAHRGMGYIAGTTTGDDAHPYVDFSLPPSPWRTLTAAQCAPGAPPTVCGATVTEQLSPRVRRRPPLRTSALVARQRNPRLRTAYWPNGYLC